MYNIFHMDTNWTFINEIKKIVIFKSFFVRNNVIILSQNGIKLKRFYAIYCLWVKPDKIADDDLYKNLPRSALQLQYTAWWLVTLVSD